MEMTAEDVLKLFLDHELEKSYSDVNTCQDLILDAMEKYASLKVAEATKWTYVRDQTPPLNTQVLASDCDGTVYLTTWRPAYNIFTCQYKTDSSLDWKWKLI